MCSPARTTSGWLRTSKQPSHAMLRSGRRNGAPSERPFPVMRSGFLMRAVDCAGENGCGLDPVTASGQLTDAIGAPQVSMHAVPRLPYLGQKVLITEAMEHQLGLLRHS